MKIKTYKEAIQYLDSLHKKELGVNTLSIYYEATKKLMELQGNPQNSLKVIHVAGTTGKGSTSTVINNLLISQGFKVGKFVSPHFRHATERITINNKQVSFDTFVTLLNEVVPTVEEMVHTGMEPPSFFAILAAMAFKYFVREGVDYAVIETGMGGRYDSTNVIQRADKVSILVKIGLDHVDRLGNTIEKIAKEKVEIIQKENLVFALDQKDSVKEIIHKKAQVENTSVEFITSSNFSNIHILDQNIIFDFKYKDKELPGIRLGTPANYLVENVALSLAVVYELLKRDKFQLNEASIREVITNYQVDGRFQFVPYKDKTILFDSAHNAQKMEGFISSLKKLHPNKKFTFILAFKKEKDIKSMLEMISTIAKKIYITEFEGEGQGMKEKSMSATEVMEYLRNLDFKETNSIPQSNILEEIELSSETMFVVTGSMYLVGDVLRSLEEKTFDNIIELEPSPVIENIMI